MKLITRIGILIFLIISTKAQTQSFEWLKTQPIDYEWNPDNLLVTNTADNDGNVYFFGMNEFLINYGTVALGSLFLNKYDADGNLLSEHLIEGEAAVTGMVSDNDGNIYIFGQYHSDIDFWGELSLQRTAVSLNHFFVKVDENGTIQWGKNTNEFQEYFSHLFDAIADNEGNTYIAYDTWSDSYISKLNAGGEVVSTIIQEDVKNISGIALDGEGNLVVAGSCAGWQSIFNGTPMPAPFAYTNYVAKYNADAGMALDWVKFVEDVTCTFTKIAVDDNNNIYWSGPAFVAMDFDDLHSEGPSWVYDFFLVKLNPSGEYQWLREVPEVVSGDASTGSLHFLEVNANGNLILGGFTRGTIEWEEGIVSEGTDLSLDVVVWEFNQEGEINWVKTAGGTARDKVNAVVCDGEGHVYISGTAGSTVTFDSITYVSDDFVYPFLAKLNTETITAISSQKATTELHIYPNPAHDVLNLDFAGIKYVTIINAQGQIIYHEAAIDNRQTINVSALKPGLYYLSAERKEGRVAGSPFIRQ